MIVTCLYEMIRIAYVLNTWLVQCYSSVKTIVAISTKLILCCTADIHYVPHKPHLKGIAPVVC